MPKYIDMDSALQAHPEFLNEQIDDHDKAIYAKGWNACNSAYYGAIKELENQTVDLNKMVPHWISVEERLPEQFICVFATDGEDVGIAAFQGFIDDYPVWSNAWNLEYIEDQYDEDFLQVTHWMPLPSTEGLNEA